MNDETTTVAENTNDAPAADQPADNDRSHDTRRRSTAETDRPEFGG